MRQGNLQMKASDTLKWIENSSDFGPCRPARFKVNETRGHASLHFAYRIFKILLSIANRAHFLSIDNRAHSSTGRTSYLFIVNLFWGFVGVFCSLGPWLGRSGSEFLGDLSDWRGGIQLPVQPNPQWHYNRINWFSPVGWELGPAHESIWLSLVGCSWCPNFQVPSFQGPQRGGGLRWRGSISFARLCGSISFLHCFGHFLTIRVWTN